MGRWSLRAVILLLVLSALFPLAVRDRAQAADFTTIDEYVQAQIDGSRIPGVAIAIVEGDQIVHARGFGELNGDGGAITAQTPFPLGSLTKSFTALSVMQLAEAGKLDLDAPVQRYIPWFQVADPAASSRITIRHLLNQTSGLSRWTGIMPVLEERRDSLEETVRNLATVELNRPVGASYEYSNANFVVLGLVVETVSGQSYADYVQQHIFAPLDMRHSYTSHTQGQQHGMVTLHRYWFGVPVATEMADLPGQAPTGYLVSSAEDMAHYLAMYLNAGSFAAQTILSPEGIATMHQPATNEFSRTLLSTEFTARYGMGWFVGSFGAEPALWHLGEMPYLNAWMVLLPQSNQGVVVLINAGSQLDLASANEVMSRIPIGVTNLLTGHEAPEGLGLTRFYLVFDLIVLAIVALQAAAFICLLRRDLPSTLRPRSRSQLLPLLRLAGPFLWEFGLSLLILIGYPALLGMGWRASWVSIPDFTLVLLTIASLWLLTGLLRALKLTGFVSTRSPVRPSASAPLAQPAAGASGS